MPIAKSWKIPTLPTLIGKSFRECETELQVRDMYALENVVLSMDYAFEKEMMEKVLADPDAHVPAACKQELFNERILFRGVANVESELRAFCEQGPNIARELGGRFGRGFYLSERPVDAARYVPGAHDGVMVFACKVLLGRARPGREADRALFAEPADADSLFGLMLHGPGHVVFTGCRVLPLYAVFCKLAARS